MLKSCLVLLAAFVLAGCATLEPRNPVPTAALSLRAEPFHMAGVRVWGDEAPSEATLDKLFKSVPRLRTAEIVNGRPVVEILALSGGGTDGAFGAGLLTGWTARGDRPEFEIVTGVSAGAIIAPFAFLGPRYDRHLREIWTRYRTNQLLTTQILPGLLGGAALADTEPLRGLIEAYIDHRLLGAIAGEYRKGRLLLVGTTNLDAERPVVWNMGEIAASRHPEALTLFREVILASAAIPGVFPPVSIKVEVNGQVYEEMHVDGSATREVFVSPLQMPFRAFDRFYEAPPVRKLYIVKNGKFEPEYKPVEERTIPIAARAIRTLIKSQNRGEIYRIYRMARDAGADFNLAFIPGTFTAQAKEAFDPQYQAALFEEGYRAGAAATRWLKAPPDVTPDRR